MKIIQSYWSRGKTNILTDQSGWVAPEYNLMSWALSCLQLKKFYKNVILYADSTTKKILIDELRLPYSEVNCELDVLNPYDPELWALPKIYAYSVQNSPFLHVDGDVFIWKAFDQTLLNHDLIAQNLESASKYYNEIMHELEMHLSYFPGEIISERKARNLIKAYNAGILGGQDFNFFKEYTRKAFDFVNKNIQQLSNIQVHNFNIFFEQYLFYCLAKAKNKNVGVLLDKVYGDNDYKGFGDFMEVPHNKQYLHILGTYKRNETVCVQLANRLRLDYPDYYYRIIRLYKKHNISLLHDYYHSGNIIPSSKESTGLKNKYVLEMLPIEDGEVDQTQILATTKPFSGLSQNQIIDLDSFRADLNSIKRKKFLRLSKSFLYGRDLNHTAYFGFLFNDLSKIYVKNLIALPNYGIIKSDYDWSKINSTPFYVENTKPGSKYTLVVPECDQNGYSLANLDLLDIEILKRLKTPKSVGRLLNNCRRMFFTDDLKVSEKEFEALIFGRIKKGIHNKVIKVV